MLSDKKSKLLKIAAFHWEVADSGHYRLIYYNDKNEKAETLIPKAQLESALNLFDGKPHLIRRSSGAYSPAIPSQLLIYNTSQSQKHSLPNEEILRVNAKFVDFKRDAEGNILNETLVAHYKNVPPSTFRILDPSTDPFTHQYWLETGKEIIPISVFDFYRTETSLIKALFVKTADLQRISGHSRGQKQKISIFSAPEAVLRVSLPEEVKDVIEVHTLSRSLQEINRSIDSHIPQFLQFGPQQTIPTGSPVDVLNQYLRICQDPHAGAMKQSLLNVMEQPSEGETTHLLPFGVFERA